MSILLNSMTKKKGIVQNGLVLYLDGKDFSNSPPTSVWKDRSGQGNNATASNFNYVSNLPGSITTDYKNKVVGDTTVNPNISKHNYGQGQTSLIVPSGFTTEANSSSYSGISILDGSCSTIINSTNGAISQQLFQFNLIADIEKQYGKPIPTSDGTVASKINWLKSNISQITANWYGYGSGPNGNSASLAMYNVVASQWTNPSDWGSNGTTTSSSVTKLTQYINTVTGWYSFTNMIDSNGFINFLAYTSASNGTIASTIYTDYINLQINFVDTSSGSDNMGGCVFDGVDDYCNCGNLPNTNLSSCGTLTATIKTNKNNGYQAIIGNVNFNLDTNGYELCISSTQVLELELANASNHVRCLGSTILTNGQQYHVTATWDGSYLKLYVNGIKEAQIAQTLTPTNTLNNLWVGNGYAYPSQFQGTIKNTLIYNRALTQQEILQNYNASR